MSKQKYHRGDIVQVAKDLGSSMRHFKSDCEAMVVASYGDLYGENDPNTEPQYQIKIKGGGMSAWYYQSQLKLIKRGPKDLVKEYK